MTDISTERLKELLAKITAIPSATATAWEWEGHYRARSLLDDESPALAAEVIALRAERRNLLFIARAALSDD